MAELVDWLHHESITRAATNTADTMCENPYFGKVWQGEKPKQTNADRIRAMTDEELAELLGKSDAYCPPLECPIPNEVCTPKVCWLAWLRKKANDD